MDPRNRSRVAPREEEDESEGSDGEIDLRRRRPVRRPRNDDVDEESGEENEEEDEEEGIISGNDDDIKSDHSGDGDFLRDSKKKICSSQ